MKLIDVSGLYNENKETILPKYLRVQSQMFYRNNGRWLR
jgi:hypothetical protein